MSQEWYYSAEGGQAGPYTTEQLLALIASAQIQQDTFVWHEGMTDWTPAGQIEQLFPASTAALSQAAPTPQSNDPYAVSQATASGISTPQGSYPSFTVKKSSYRLHLIIGLIIPSALCIAMLCIFIFAGVSASNHPNEELSDPVATTIGLGFALLIGGFYISTIASSIIGLIHLYRAWFCIQPGRARATPGQAVGFLFIPFFNLYWYFIAYKGLADDWNRIMDSYEDLAPAPRLDSGVFLTFAICYIVFPPVAVIFYFMAHHQICKGINFMASRQATGGNEKH